MMAFFDANVIDWSNIDSFGTSRRRDYRGQNKVATMNPGLAHVAVAWQLAAEIIVPLNREVGNSTGCRTQLMFFLDDLIPKLFDKLLLSDKPDRSLIAWHG